MMGHPYDGGPRRLGATIDGETINLTDDDIYIALMDSTYGQDVAADVHWDDVSAHGIVSGTGHPAGGVPLTITEDEIYIESTLYAPFRYLVYTANTTPVAPNTIPYSVEFDSVTFTDITGAAIYKKGVEIDGSDWPLFTFISELTIRSADNDKYWVKFGNPGVTLGFYAELLGTPAPE